MIEIKANRKDDGVDIGVDIELAIDGRVNDLGLETLFIIGNLMTEIKKMSPNVHKAILGTLANESSILLGNVKLDKETEFGKGVS